MGGSGCVFVYYILQMGEILEGEGVRELFGSVSELISKCAFSMVFCWVWEFNRVERKGENP